MTRGSININTGFIEITEEDGSPKCQGYQIKVTNGGLIDNSDGSCSLDLSVSGDVLGPIVSTDNAFVRFDGTTGKLIQNSQTIEDDSGNVSINGTLSISSLISGSIPFGSSLGLIQQDNSNLFWNDTDDEFYLGGTSLNNAKISLAADGKTLFKNFITGELQANSQVEILRNSAESSGNTYALFTRGNKTGAGSSGVNYGAQLFALSSISSGTQTTTIGGNFLSHISSNQTHTNVYGAQFDLKVLGTNTPIITNFFANKTTTFDIAGAVVSNAGIFDIPNITIGAGSCQNFYGIRIAALSGATRNWGINSLAPIQLGDDTNLYFDGNATTVGTTYFIYDSTGSTLDNFVGGIEIWNASSSKLTIEQEFLANKELSLKSVTKTSAYTAAEESVIYGDTTSSGFTITLPLSNNTDRIYFIKNIGTGGNTLTVDGNGSETIDGVATKSLADFEAITVHSDGTQWFIL